MQLPTFLIPFGFAKRPLSRRTCVLLMILRSVIHPAFAAKADRLKQAKQEAEKEIKAYKAQREEQFQKRMSDVRPAPYYKTYYRNLVPARHAHTLGSTHCCRCSNISSRLMVVVMQDSSSSGANVKRLDSESAKAVKDIEKNIASKKKEVGRPPAAAWLP